MGHISSGQGQFGFIQTHAVLDTCPTIIWMGELFSVGYNLLELVSAHPEEIAWVKAMQELQMSTFSCK